MHPTMVLAHGGLRALSECNISSPCIRIGAVRSVKLPADATLTLYKGVFFDGKSTTLTDWEPCLQNQTLSAFSYKIITGAWTTD